MSVRSESTEGKLLERSKDEQLFDVGVRLANILIEESPNIPRSASMPFLALMLFFFEKSYRTYQAIQIIWLLGYCEYASTLARSIFELRLKALYSGREAGAAVKAGSSAVFRFDV